MVVNLFIEVVLDELSGLSLSEVGPSGRSYDRIRQRKPYTLDMSSPYKQQTFDDMLTWLQNIIQEDNQEAQRDKAERFDFHFIRNQSVYLPQNIRTQVEDILSNVTYVGDKGVANQMLSELEAIHKVPLTISLTRLCTHPSIIICLTLNSANRLRWQHISLTSQNIGRGTLMNRDCCVSCSGTTRAQ